MDPVQTHAERLIELWDVRLQMRTARVLRLEDELKAARESQREAAETLGRLRAPARTDGETSRGPIRSGV